MNDWLNRVPRTMGDWLTLAAGVALVVLGIFLLPRLLAGAGALLGILTPFAWGLVLAYVLDIPTRFLAEKLCRGRRMPAILLSYLLLFGAVVVLLALVVPQLAQSVTSFAGRVPDYTGSLRDLLAWVQGTFGINTARVEALIADSGAMLEQLLGGVLGSAPELAGAAAGVAGGAMNGFVSLAVSIYLLAGKENLLHGARLALRATLPPRAAGSVFSVCTMANRTFGSYIGGQLLDALLVGAETFVLMAVLGLDYAPLIAVLVGVTNIIPVLGPFIGAAPGAVLLLLESPLQAVEFIVIIVAVQQIDGNFIAPRILGGAIGLSGLGVLLAIIVGGDLFGIPGMIVGVPVLAVAMNLLRQAVGAGLHARGIEDEGET